MNEKNYENNRWQSIDRMHKLRIKQIIKGKLRHILILIYDY